MSRIKAMMLVTSTSAAARAAGTQHAAVPALALSSLPRLQTMNTTVTTAPIAPTAAAAPMALTNKAQTPAFTHSARTRHQPLPGERRALLATTAALVHAGTRHMPSTNCLALQTATSLSTTLCTTTAAARPASLVRPCSAVHRPHPRLTLHTTTCLWARGGRYC